MLDNSREKEFVLVPRKSFPRMLLGSTIYNRIERIGLKEWKPFIKAMKEYEEAMDRPIEEVAESCEDIYPVLTAMTKRKVGEDGKSHTYIIFEGQEIIDPFFDED